MTNDEKSEYTFIDYDEVKAWERKLESSKPMEMCTQCAHKDVCNRKGNVTEEEYFNLLRDLFNLVVSKDTEDMFTVHLDCKFFMDERDSDH